MKGLSRVVIFFGVILTFGVLALGGCSQNTANTQAPAMTTLRVGIVPSEDAQKIREAYKPLMSYLEKKTGLHTDLFVATDYSGVVEAMRAGKVDVALYGPFSYVLAADKANAEVFVVENRKGTGTTYKSIIVTNPDSGINSLEDLKGHSFAFVDPASTSGNLIPRAAMKAKGIDPEKDFKSVVYSGGHDADELAVKNRKVDAAADDDITYGEMKNQGILTDKDVKVIWVSDPIPGSPWAWRKDLPDDLKVKLKAAFLNVAEEDPAALSAYGEAVEGYVEYKDSDYNIIRETAKILNLDLSKK